MARYVAQKTNRLPSVGKMSHRVVLCTMQDVVNEAGEMRLTRQGVREVWASIEERRGSFFNREGEAIREAAEQRSHKICLRVCPDIEISGHAWVYEQRKSLASRWFKILDVSEERGTEVAGRDARFWCLHCRLVERSDEVSKPVAPPTEPAVAAAPVPLPAGVRL